MDASHSQLVLTDHHLGFSTPTSMFSGFIDQIRLDLVEPVAPSVSVSFSVKTTLTGWRERFDRRDAEGFL